MKNIDKYPSYFFTEAGEIWTTNYRNSGRTEIMHPAKDKKGYLRTVLVDNDGKNKTIKVHRIIAEAFIPNPENKPQVNHKNGNKSDNSVGNLEWATNTENKDHAIKNGLFTKPKYGLDNPASKYSDEFVKKILERISSGVPKRVACREAGVDRSVLRRKFVKPVTR